MTTTTTRKRASRAADQDQQQPQEQPEAAAKPGPSIEEGKSRMAAEPASPYALIDSETYPKTFHRPRVRVCVPTPDGGEQVETIDRCEHMDRYGHESEKAALACARKIAAQRGLRIGAK
jgi:hypothetical protein